MKRILTLIIIMVMSLSFAPFDTKAYADEAFETLRFDLGGAGVADGYIGVSADGAYSKQVGYGFTNTAAV
mgnify:FL=1